MNKYLERINELYECRNMVKYLKDKYNYDNKAPIEISTFLSTTRVVLSLTNKYRDFLKENNDVSVYQLTARASLFELVEIVNILTGKHSEDDDFNMTQKQKEKLCELVEAIEKGLLNMTGFLAFEYEANDIPLPLDQDQTVFVEEGKRQFALHVKTNDKVLGGDDIGDEIPVDAEGNEIITDDEDDGIILSASNGKKKIKETKVKPNISTDVDKV